MNRDLKSYKKKTIIVLIVQFIVISLGMIVIVSSVMLPNINELESKYVIEHLLRLEKSFELRLEHIEKISKDWAIWDDTYFFMQEEDPNYINSNMTYSTLENLNLDLIMYIDSLGKIKYASKVNHETKSLVAVDKDIINTIEYAQIFELNKSHKGLIEVDHSPIMIVSQPIKLSDGSGDISGNFIMGSYINDELAKELSSELGIIANIKRYDENVHSHLREINILNQKEIEGSVVLNDLNEKPFIVLKMEMERGIRKLGSESVLKVILSFFFIHIVFTSMIFFYFNKKVLSKMGDYQNKLGSSESKLAELNEQLEKSINEKTRRLNAIIQAIPDIIFKLDKDGNFLDSEGNDSKWLLASEKEIIGKNLRDILPIDIAKQGLKELKKAIKTKTITKLEYELDFDGTKTYFEARFISTKTGDVFVITRDVTELNENKRYIEYLSYHDQLTKIHNRRYYEEEIINLDCEENLPLTVAMIDINGLKLINDTFGHNKGDILISKVAEILKSFTRDHDLLARIGGDEFAFVFPRTTYKEGQAIINQIQEIVRETSLENMYMSISIGIDTKTKEKESLNEKLVAAENKMYGKKLIEGQLMREKTVEGILTRTYEESSVNKDHSIKVKDYCILVGKELNYSLDMMDELEKSALLHDIGKVSIDKKLIDMPRALNLEEIEQVKKHAENGYQLLRTVASYATIAENVLSHHENWDGSGYPRRIKGDEIPEISRIIAIADAYESMISYRPYKEKMTKGEAIKELQRYSGTKFDPNIVDIFIHKCI